MQNIAKCIFSYLFPLQSSSCFSHCFYRSLKAPFPVCPYSCVSVRSIVDVKHNCDRNIIFLLAFDFCYCFHKMSEREREREVFFHDYYLSICILCSSFYKHICVCVCVGKRVGKFVHHTCFHMKRQKLNASETKVEQSLSDGLQICIQINCKLKIVAD